MIITVSLRFIIVITMMSSIILGILNAKAETGGSHYFMNAFTCLIMFIITFVPSFLHNNTKLIFPTALQTGIVIFTFLAMYLGEIFRYYERFWWWDVMLHSTSGFMLGLIGFILLYSLNDDKDVLLKMNNFCIMLFAFCFAMSAGAMWEIFEFSGDYLLGMNMQKSVYVTDINELSVYVNQWGRFMDPGLTDTMKDIIVDAIGALVAVLGCFFFYRKKKGRLISKSLEGKKGGE